MIMRSHTSVNLAIAKKDTETVMDLNIIQRVYILKMELRKSQRKIIVISYLKLNIK